MRPIRKIIIHCSDSEFGDVKAIDYWHRTDPEKLFSLIGYHFILCNGHRTAKSEYSTEVDGLIEYGRTEGMEGAHCRAGGNNRNSIGICLIGKKDFTKTQMVVLMQFLKKKMAEYKLCPKDVFGHYELDPGKTCPNLDMDLLRANLLDELHPVSGVEA